MLLVGAEVHGVFDDDDGDFTAHPVRLLTAFERMDLGELLGESSRRTVPPPPPPAPKFQLPGRATRGFVQLQVNVDESGRVTDVAVLDAMPAGVYEQDAVREVSRKLYPPAIREGIAVPDTVTEIVEFSVPPES
jgi:TonB family protein